MNTRPGLRASAPRISNSTNVRLTLSPRTATDRFAEVDGRSPISSGGSVSCSGAGCISARRSAALTRERNSRIENGLVM